MREVPRTPTPPAHVQVYVDVLGTDRAIAFLLEFGGAELYLATRPKRHSRLAQLVGVQKAHELACQSRRIPSRIPTAKPWIAAVMKTNGLSVADIARKLHMSDVAVRGWLKKAGLPPECDPRQGQLNLL